MLRVGYTRTEMVDSVDDIQHELICEAFKLTGISRQVEISTMGDIPAGSGLGSSSTVTVGALHAMHAYRNEAYTSNNWLRKPAKSNWIFYRNRRHSRPVHCRVRRAALL